MEITTVNGALLRTAGQDSAPLLLLLPGFADNGTMFAPLFRTRLADKFRLAAVDLPGFGAAPRNEALASLVEFGAYVAELARAITPGQSVGIVAHSVASVIACKACNALGERAIGLFSIEGNLTAADAYFSGKAADHSEAHAFKSAFLDEIWRMADDKPILRRYHAAAEQSDAEAMWRLGRDAMDFSMDNMPGRQLLALQTPKLYYWSPANTPDTTTAWIEAHPELPCQKFNDASHWPSVDHPDETASAISKFFGVT
jgi:pimeloyl-ACP methyl ester carboxylesterase